MSQTLKHFIGGNWVKGTEHGQKRSPADTRIILATYPLATAQEVSQAVVAAQDAFEHFRKFPPPLRGELVHQLGTLVRDNKTSLAEVITQEMGKPITESLGSVQEVIDTCIFFSSEGRRLYGHTVPSELPNKKLFTYRKPVGVCGIITAGNFPIAVPAWYLVPALLCGNTVIWKPAEEAPMIAYYFTQLFEKAGFPKGTMNLVLGDAQAGQALVQAAAKNQIQKIGFTGSTEVGQNICAQVAHALHRPCLELGGKNPMVIMEDAPLEAAVEATLFSAFGTAGQRCTSLGTLFLHERIQEKFLKHFLDKVKSMAIGDPKNPKVFYGPLMSERTLQRYEKFCTEWIKPHHHVLSPSQGRIRTKNSWENLIQANLEHGLYAHPVVVSGVTPKDELFLQETFGPIIGVCTFKTLDEAIALANTSGYGLSAAIFTQTPKAVFQFQEDIRAGMVSINNSTSGAEAHLPFGGVGRSGNGSRQSGIWVLDEFTSWQAVNWDYSGGLQRAQIDT